MVATNGATDATTRGREMSAETPLEEAVAAYLTACAVEGKTVRTLQAYRETLAQFAAICTRDALPADVAAFRALHIYTFLKGVADRGVSLGTRHRRYRETRAFFSWCTRMEFCAQNPFTGIPNVKVEQRIIQPLTEAEIGALLAICDARTEFGCRNRAIILLFLDTGMRYSELHRLTVADCAWDARRIHIRHGKPILLGMLDRGVPRRLQPGLLCGRPMADLGVDAGGVARANLLHVLEPVVDTRHTAGRVVDDRAHATVCTRSVLRPACPS